MFDVDGFKFKAIASNLKLTINKKEPCTMVKTFMLQFLEWSLVGDNRIELLTSCL